MVLFSRKDCSTPSSSFFAVTALVIPDCENSGASAAIAFFLSGCRTRPSLLPTTICCPSLCAASAGKKTASYPSSVRTSSHFSGDNAGLPGRRSGVSWCSHHPSSKPNVRCANKDQLLISLRRRTPWCFNVAFAFRSVSLLLGVACNTLVAITTSYQPAAIDCDTGGLETSKIAVL